MREFCARGEQGPQKSHRSRGIRSGTGFPPVLARAHTPATQDGTVT
jgi:hypothetical protein